MFVLISSNYLPVRQNLHHTCVFHFREMKVTMLVWFHFSPTLQVLDQCLEILAIEKDKKDDSLVVTPKLKSFLFSVYFFHILTVSIELALLQARSVFQHVWRAGVMSSGRRRAEQR